MVDPTIRSRRGAPLCAVLLALCCAVPARAYLAYTLSSELKKTNCANDTDSDCLDNAEEGNLAWAAAPWYFYDEDEDCSAWENRFGLPAFHFARQDFFQIRPEGGGIRGWSGGDGRAKWVRLRYFFIYPHDCKNLGGSLSGHQGDPEHIELRLYSYDLRTWYLFDSIYHHHNQQHAFSGTYHEDRARALGTSWISVAADEDSKGSFPGWQVNSSHCAGSEDDFCAGTCDCFQSTWQSDFANGYVEAVSASRNIGGPPPYESWNGSVLTVSGADAYTQMDVGHGLNREYWTPRNDQFKKCCGWECPSGNRLADGNCSLTVHERSNCVDPLSQKVDTNEFFVDGCVGHCGGAGNGGCYCDPACVGFGDCCFDACLACGVC